MADSTEAFIAATRFGLGAKHGDLAAISTDPRGWLTLQLDARYAPQADIQGPPDDGKDASAEPCVMMCASPAAGDDQPDAARSQRLKEILAESNKRYTALAAARTRAFAASAAPFFERLVQFWSNHFTVSVSRRQDLDVLASFEHDVIRPNVLGNFKTMLQASTHHPAMLTYLDNILSAGRESSGGMQGDTGLNENLAREVLELHSLGVNGGYTQADVTEFAQILTGWTCRAAAEGRAREFFFAKRQHEPGEKKLLGVTYDDGGVEEGEHALDALAKHPATAKFIATKLARHFIADDPPPEAVDKLATAFKEHDGAFIPVYQALIALDAAWKDPLPKLKTPNDVVLSVLRATGMAADLSDAKLIAVHKQSGQMPWSAPSPAGWSDRAADWMGAEALLQRVDFARFAARNIHTRVDPVELMQDTIGPVATSGTRDAVTRAGSAEDAITLLFASPEFQRR
jgi:uncharacterized protein (DUF1800 family)